MKCERVGVDECRPGERGVGKAETSPCESHVASGESSVLKDNLGLLSVWWRNIQRTFTFSMFLEKILEPFLRLAVVACALSIGFKLSSAALCLSDLRVIGLVLLLGRILLYSVIDRLPNIIRGRLDAFRSNLRTHLENYVADAAAEPNNLELSKSKISAQSVDTKSTGEMNCSSFAEPSPSSVMCSASDSDDVGVVTNNFSSVTATNLDELVLGESPNNAVVDISAVLSALSSKAQYVANLPENTFIDENMPSNISPSDIRFKFPTDYVLYSSNSLSKQKFVSNKFGGVRHELFDCDSNEVEIDDCQSGERADHDMGGHHGGILMGGGYGCSTYSSLFSHPSEGAVRFRKSKAHRRKRRKTAIGTSYLTGTLETVIGGQSKAKRSSGSFCSAHSVLTGTGSIVGQCVDTVMCEECGKLLINARVEGNKSKRYFVGGRTASKAEEVDTIEFHLKMIRSHFTEIRTHILMLVGVIFGLFRRPSWIVSKFMCRSRCQH